MEQAEAFQEDTTEVESTTEVEQRYQPEEASNDEEELQAQEGAESESEEDLFEEVDYEGNTYKLPPELKAALLRQSDYTQKTQEVAAQRRALEQQALQIQQAVEMQRTNMQGYAQMQALQNRLGEFKDVDWATYSRQNPQEAQQAFFEYSQLKDAVSNLGNQLQRQQQQALQQQRAIRAKRLEQGQAELARDIPGWSAELAKSLIDYGKQYNFSDGELNTIVDPRMIKVLHDAAMYRKSLDNAAHKPANPAKPVTKIKSKSGGTKDPNKMSMDEWLKWRNKQLS